MTVPHMAPLAWPPVFVALQGKRAHARPGSIPRRRHWWGRAGHGPINKSSPRRLPSWLAVTRSRMFDVSSASIDVH
jgi:hypothetical protein